MKELDFDELDRAVNTLMGDVSKTTPPPSLESDVTTVTIPSTTTESDAPSITSSAPAVRSSAQLPATRRGGRFMDVVHPSSDMRAASSVPARPVSRQGVTVTPAPTRPDISVANQPADVTTPPASLEAQSSGEWPDPLDMAGYHREPDTATAETKPAFEQPQPEVAAEPVAMPTDVELIAPAPDETPREEVEQPLSSPFLTDAKVEKRPLGSNTDPSVEEPDHTPVLGALADADTLAVSDPANQLPATPAPVESDVVLPEELSTDLVSVESDERDAPAAVSPVVTTSPVASTTGPTSIPQQYKEQPNTGDQTNGGIFDTASYHKPLEHPAKKKSSWMWVVWIVVLLILGAAGGAAAYLFLLK